MTTTYETELMRGVRGAWQNLAVELTTPKDPVWEMFEYRLKCAYCGMTTREPIREADVNSTLREHRKKCSKHPCRELEREIEVLKIMLRKHAPQLQAEFEAEVGDIVGDMKKKQAKPAKKVRRKKVKK